MYSQQAGSNNQNKNSRKPDSKGNINLTKKLPKVMVNFQLFDFKNMSERRKIFFAAIATFLIIAVIAIGYNFISNANFRNSFFNNINPFSSQSSNRQNGNSTDTARLRQILSNFDQTAQYYRKYGLKDLDIYPQAWVNRNFNESERRNSLVSSAEADPDGDGLTNKEEYMFGSNPKKARSICDGQPLGSKPIATSPFTCDSRNDKELVDSGISPLTGLELDTLPEFTVLNQDISIVNSLKESFEKAAEEGVDFPVLFQASKTIDLSDQMNRISVITVEDTSNNILSYRDFRLSALENFITENQFSSLSQIYQLTQVEQFANIKKQYQDQIRSLENASVPKRYVESHKAYLMIMNKLTELVDLRSEAFVEKKTGSQEYKDKSYNKAVEIMWGYRRLQEEQAKIRE
jgi:hypothetical protein